MFIKLRAPCYGTLLAVTPVYLLIMLSEYFGVQEVTLKQDGVTDNGTRQKKN